jgi:DNA polymerase I-like protein with 3'-5' exonuclease and polymerase domains
MPGTFIAHIKKVEFDFWNRRFKVYKQWKDSWWEEYQRTGQAQTLTGFVFDGLYDRKKIINYPIQGTAFHCLLWSLIRLQKLLMKKRMKSLIVGQIHDSIVADVPAKEKDDYLELANRVMTVDIKKHWNWITTPIEVEAEVTPLNRSWFEKEEVKISI